MSGQRADGRKSVDSKNSENKCPCIWAQQGHRSRAQWGSEARVYAGGRVRAENQGQSEVEMIPQGSVEENVPREHRRGNQHSTWEPQGSLCSALGVRAFLVVNKRVTLPEDGGTIQCHASYDDTVSRVAAPPCSPWTYLQSPQLLDNITYDFRTYMPTVTVKTLGELFSCPYDITWLSNGKDYTQKVNSIWTPDQPGHLSHMKRNSVSNSCITWIIFPRYSSGCRFRGKKEIVFRINFYFAFSKL